MRASFDVWLDDVEEWWVNEFLDAPFKKRLRMLASRANTDAKISFADLKVDSEEKTPGTLPSVR